jgi:sigma-E factor negative regulatory protein RseB
MRRVTLLLLLGSVSAALMGQGLAEEGTGSALLRRAARAATRTDYHGMQILTVWTNGGTVTALVEVSHAAGHGMTVRVERTSDDSLGSSVGDRLFRADGATLGLARLDSDALDLLARNYDAEVAGPDTVVGRIADLVVIRRPGGSAVARYWVDRASHLVLRREVLEGDGHVVRETAFISLELERPFLDKANAVSLARPSGLVLEPGALAELGRSGWVLPTSMPAGMSLFDLRMSEAGTAPVLHLSYTDGLSHLSVFEQRGRLDRSGMSGWRRTSIAGHMVWEQPGYPRRVVWGGAGVVYTLVADCSSVVLDGVVNSLPHERRHRGFWSRLWRGLGRVGSWINPFE